MTRLNIGAGEKPCQDFCAAWSVQVSQGLAPKRNVVNHVGAGSLLSHIPCVRPTLKRILVTLTTLVLGLLLGALHRPAVPGSPALALAPNAVSETEPTDATYPEDLDIDPFTISAFLRGHPNAKLGPLWRRLGIPANTPYYSNDACSGCEPNTFQYNLDDDSAPEVVLQIKEPFAESVKYLIFKDTRRRNSKLIGHVEIWSKYTSSDPVAFASNGRTWLIIQGTAATGSGLAAWVNMIYDVSDGRVRPMASYFARVSEAGNLGFPYKDFIANPVSAEIEKGKFVLTLACKVEYSGRPFGELPLFTKQQKVVLVNSLKDQSYEIDEARSEVAPVEFESVYNYDSMTAADFLRYNRFELFAIARGPDDKKKQWLRDFLETCPSYPTKRELMVGLRSSPRASTTSGN